MELRHCSGIQGTVHKFDIIMYSWPGLDAPISCDSECGQEGI